jgi:hypothetical protein
MKEPTADLRMIDLQEQVLAFDSNRVNVLIDVLRVPIKAARAPLNEVLWSTIAVIVALIQSQHDSRGETLDLVHRMLALRMELAERLRQPSDQVH